MKKWKRALNLKAIHNKGKKAKQKQMQKATNQRKTNEEIWLISAKKMLRYAI